MHLRCLPYEFCNQRSFALENGSFWTSSSAQEDRKGLLACNIQHKIWSCTTDNAREASHGKTQACLGNKLLAETYPRVTEKVATRRQVIPGDLMSCTRKISLNAQYATAFRGGYVCHSLTDLQRFHSSCKVFTRHYCWRETK